MGRFLSCVTSHEFWIQGATVLVDERAGTQLMHYFTSSKSPGFHVLSNQGSNGP